MTYLEEITGTLDDLVGDEVGTVEVGNEVRVYGYAQPVAYAVPAERVRRGIPARFIANLLYDELGRRVRRVNYNPGDAEIDRMWLGRAIEDGEVWVFIVATGAGSFDTVGYLPLAPAMLRRALRRPYGAHIPMSIWTVEGRRMSVDIAPTIGRLRSHLYLQHADLEELIAAMGEAGTTDDLGYFHAEDDDIAGHVVCMPVTD